MALHDNNVIHVTLGGDHTHQDRQKYEMAGSRFRDWLASGVLVREEEPLYFVYGMNYYEAGKSGTTVGLIASLGLEDFGSGEILPHERTIPGPKRDRLELMRATEANLEPLWFFASSPISGFRTIMESAMREFPVAEVVDMDGVRHTLWQLRPRDAGGIAETIAEIPLVIADGHHRYETALAYRQERTAADGPGPWDDTLALIVDPVDYPPLLRPIHRLVHGMSVGQIAELVADAAENNSKQSDDGSGETGAARRPEKASVPLEKVSGELEDLLKLVEDAGPGTLGVVTAQGSWIVRTHSDLDTAYLNDAILEPSGADVRYEHEPEQVEAMLAAGAVAFVLAPAPIDLVASKALAGERMPPKTTLFWPKPRTGFLMRDLRLG